MKKASEVPRETMNAAASKPIPHHALPNLPESLWNPRQDFSRSSKVGNPIASILKGNGEGIPTRIVLNPVSNFLGFTL